MNKKYILLGILILATLLRVINLSSGDMNGSDEVFYSFRAVGMLDFDNAPRQTTPLQWQDPNIQWWSYLSMHDHPLLVFLVQHVSMGIFGENTFGFRIPSALLGILSVYLVYLIAKKLISENAALFAAALTAITLNHVYISRLGIQESYVIFFLLLASHLFLKALDNKKYFLWTGMILGLAFLTKYITFIAVPIFITYLLIFRRGVFRQKHFWLGIALTAIIASPILIYNLQLYRAVGHFDFQFSFIFGQDPEVWKSAPGKEEIGSLGNRLLNFVPNLFNTHSWMFLVLVTGALGYFVIRAIHPIRSGPQSNGVQRKDRELFRQKAFVDIALVWLVILILFIGPTFRFLTLLTPFLAIKAGVFVAVIYSRERLRKSLIAISALFIVCELFYTLNSVVRNYPTGPQFWLWSKVSYDRYNWGFNELDEYLNKELGGRLPAATFDLRYQFLEDIKKTALDNARRRGDKPYSAMLVFDGNLHLAAQLWILGRRQIYHGWPTINAETYLAAPQKPAAEHNYFIRATEHLPVKKGQQLNIFGAQLEQQLLQSGVYPEILKNKRGEEVFRVYKFVL